MTTQTSTTYTAENIEDIFEPQQEVQLSPAEFAAQKKEQRESLYALADETAMDVIQHHDSMLEFLSLQARINRNYTATNALLVLAQSPHATQLGDAEYWNGQGTYITSGKGSGIAILKGGDSYLRDDGSVGKGIDVKQVFDISQVNIKKLKPTTPKPQYTDVDMLKSLGSNPIVPISFTDQLPDNSIAMYDSESKSVFVCKGAHPKDTIIALTTELAKATLDKGEKTPANSDFSAHCVAYMACERYGVEMGVAFDDAPNIFADMDVRQVRSELSQISEAFKDMSMRMARTLEPQNRDVQNRGGNGSR